MTDNKIYLIVLFVVVLAGLYFSGFLPFSIFTLPAATITQGQNFFVTGLCDAGCASAIYASGIYYGSQPIDQINSLIAAQFTLKGAGQDHQIVAKFEKCAAYGNRLCSVVRFNPTGSGSYTMTFKVVKSGTELWSESVGLNVVPTATPAPAPSPTPQPGPIIVEPTRPTQPPTGQTACPEARACGAGESRVQDGTDQTGCATYQCVHGDPICDGTINPVTGRCEKKFELPQQLILAAIIIIVIGIGGFVAYRKLR